MTNLASLEAILHDLFEVNKEIRDMAMRGGLAHSHLMEAGSHVLGAVENIKKDIMSITGAEIETDRNWKQYPEWPTLGRRLNPIMKRLNEALQKAEALNKANPGADKLLGDAMVFMYWARRELEKELALGSHFNC